MPGILEILKKSKKSRARVGLLKTKHGIVETPCLVPVATQGTIKSLTMEQVEETKTQILIANAFHLHLKPGDKLVGKLGGLNDFSNWNRPFMTDSGGFQVFSLGFGSDFNTGKILKEKNRLEGIKKNSQPKSLRITEEGVFFRSPVDGREIFMGPKESIKIQENLGADIIFSFDECPSPLASRKYIEESIKKTHRWAKICLKEKKTEQSLFGIVQGGKYKDLRLESAEFFSKLDFDGFGLGGEFGIDKKIMSKIISYVLEKLPEEKPRHLLGIGYLEDIPLAIKNGVDTFDCIVPTRFARHNMVFSSNGRMDISKSEFLKNKNPIDKKCSCYACQNHSRAYICHLLKAKEMSALSLMTIHNLYFFNSFMEKIRDDIKRGKM